MSAVQNLLKNRTYLMAFADHKGTNYSSTLALSTGFCAVARQRGYGVHGGGYAVAAEIIPEQNIPFDVAQDILREVSAEFGRNVVFAANENGRGEKINTAGPNVIKNLRSTLMFTAAP